MSQICEFIKKNMLIEENIKYITRHKVIKDNLVSITWKVTNYCNYNCPYCIQGVHKEPPTDLNVVYNIANQINEKLKKIPSSFKINFNLFGGEISSYPLGELLNKLFINVSCDSNVIFTTNLSGSIENYISFFKNSYVKNKNLVASYHPLSSNMDLFLKKCIELKNYGNLRVRYVILKTDTLNYIKQLREKFIKNNISLNLVLDKHYNAEDFHSSIFEYLKNCVDSYKGSIIYVTTKDNKIYKFSDTISLYNEFENKDLNLKGCICKKDWFISPDGTCKLGNCKITSRNKYLLKDINLLNNKIVCEDTHCKLTAMDYLKYE